MAQTAHAVTSITTGTGRDRTVNGLDRLIWIGGPAIVSCEDSRGQKSMPRHRCSSRSDGTTRIDSLLAGFMSMSLSATRRHPGPDPGICDCSGGLRMCSLRNPASRYGARIIPHDRRQPAPAISKPTWKLRSQISRMGHVDVQNRAAVFDAFVASGNVLQSFFENAPVGSQNATASRQRRKHRRLHLSRLRKLKAQTCRVIPIGETSRPARVLKVTSPGIRFRVARWLDF